jgi:4-hydroxybenzoate polyprenyltransferase
MRAWGRLLRLSLAPSAAADVACGLVLASGGGWPGGRLPWLLIGASLCVYHGALALNDWADRGRDARERPERPIPSRAITPGAALLVAVLLLGLGPLLAASAAQRAGLWMAGVALCAAAYDLAGRGPWRGPLLLAACRGGNLALGPVALGALGAATPAVIYGCALYAAYVLTVSRLGRLEDGEDQELAYAPGLALLAAALLALPPALPATLPAARAASALVAWSGAAGLFLLVRRTRGAWARASVMRAMGMALRRLLVLTAALTLCAWRPPDPAPLLVAAAILCGYPAAWGLRRVFPPS